VPIIAFINLITAIIAHRSAETIIGLFIGALVETRKALDIAPDKIDQVLKEPFDSALKLVEDAKLATTRSFRDKCLSDARLKFIAAMSLEPTAVMRIRALFSAGVCADLVGEPNIALHDYESSYDECLAFEEVLWERRSLFGKIPAPRWPPQLNEAIQRSVAQLHCSDYSRTDAIRLMAAVFVTTTGGNRELTDRLQGNPVKDLENLYPLMKRIIEVLRVRGSKHRQLVPASELRVADSSRGMNLALRRMDVLCPRSSRWWTGH
jgi:hypothetical protein